MCVSSSCVSRSARHKLAAFGHRFPDIVLEVTMTQESRTELVVAGFDAGIALGESGKIPAWLGLWLPNLIAAGLTAFLLRRICLEQWQSIGDGIAGFNEWRRSLRRSAA